MVATTGLGDIRTHPWLRAAVDVFTDAVGRVGPVLDVGCGPGTVTAYEQLVRLVEQAGLRLTAELRLPAEGPIGPTVVLVAERER
jgi:hypothetical protein